MKVAVFGLGYVGCVSGACLAELGHDVIGVDVNPIKVEMINSGKAPMIEKRLSEFMDKVTRTGKFVATSDWEKAVSKTDISLVCVGTPSEGNGSISLDVVRRVSEQIGKALKNKRNYYVVAMRSTVLPGTVEGEVIPILEKYSQKSAGKDFGICMVPEFLREGSSVDDFFHPPKSVIGELDIQSGEAVVEIFKRIEAPIVRTRIKIAEMLKYADNSFHALKVSFANEIGNICKELACDSHEVMKIFCMDYKLNLSPYYLKPGFAFGGSCLPKDIRAITYKSKMLDVDTPVLNAILESNKKQIAKVVRKILSYKGCSLGFLGLSFKHGTDDLRESPIVEVIETMIGKGFSVKIYDEYVSIAKLVGSNKEYIEKEIPHISSLICSSAKELVKKSDIIIVCNYSAEFKEVVNTEVGENHVVIDLVRIVQEPTTIKGTYDGVCW
ncbi:MAG: nucleotide sugar dehydrogenase [Thermodesulfobacteriota bacterium]